MWHAVFIVISGPLPYLPKSDANPGLRPKLPPEQPDIARYMESPTLSTVRCPDACTRPPHRPDVPRCMGSSAVTTGRPPETWKCPLKRPGVVALKTRRRQANTWTRSLASPDIARIRKIAHRNDQALPRYRASPVRTREQCSKTSSPPPNRRGAAELRRTTFCYDRTLRQHTESPSGATGICRIHGIAEYTDWTPPQHI